MRTFYINLIFFISFCIAVLATLGWGIFINQTFPNLHWSIRSILGGLGGFVLGYNLLGFVEKVIKLLKI